MLSELFSSACDVPTHVVFLLTEKFEFSVEEDGDLASVSCRI